MQIVLKETVHNLGGAGSIVKVKDGYARNYLIPRGLAIPATAGAHRHIQHIQRLAEKKRATEIADARDLKTKLEALNLVVEAKAEGGSNGCRKFSRTKSPPGWPWPPGRWPGVCSTQPLRLLSPAAKPSSRLKQMPAPPTWSWSTPITRKRCRNSLCKIRSTGGHGFTQKK